MADHSHRNQGTGGRAGRWIFWGFILIAGFFLLSEHRAHTLQYLPFLLLLICPLMHLFHGHGGHDGPQEKGAPEQKSADGAKPDSDTKPRGGCH